MGLWRVKPLDVIIKTAAQKPLKRTLGALDLTLLGIGAVIGTGIFVLTSEAAQKAGPGMILSFLLAGTVCALAALCYAELAAMVPVAGSAYIYTYSVLGEPIAWIVGWALILEYSVGSSAVSVGWSGYVVGLIEHLANIDIPHAITAGPAEGGIINLPALLIALLITGLLVLGTTESAFVNSILVIIKIIALTTFIILSVPVAKLENFQPFLPTGLVGVSAAAASIFFAYTGFDAVSTAAEETKDPQKNLPIGLVGSLAVCTVFYIIVSIGVIGIVGANPLFGSDGNAIAPGSIEFANACKAINGEALVCSKEALAWALRKINHPAIGNLLGLAAGVALPSVILMMMYGQTRIFFVMSRDGLLPSFFSKIHSKFGTPYIVTITTGIAVAIFSAFFPVGQLAEISNSGILLAFAMVSFAVLFLRHKDPERKRPFRTPFIWVVAPLAFIGSVYLFSNLSAKTLKLSLIWGVIGIIVYFLYGYKNSHVGKGLVELHENDADVPPTSLPPI